MKPRKYVKTGTRNALVRDTVARLRSAGITDAVESAEWIATDVFDCSRADLWSDTDARVDAELNERFESMVVRRMSHEPVQYIVGSAYFFGLRFFVDPRVLIPRPETEQLVEKAISMIRDIGRPRVLDIGTGSGCIAVALAHRLPKSVVIACDLSTAALDVAHINAEEHDTRVTFLQADALNEAFTDRFSQPFDLIVSNPPYIPASERSSIMPEVRDFEPEEALFVFDDPVIFYRVIARHSRQLLTDRGGLALEIHADYGHEASQAVRNEGFRDVDVSQDLAGKPRVVTARM